MHWHIVLNKDYPTAIQRYEYLVSQGDSSFHTCYYLGISYYAAEKYYEAHDFLEAARKHDPEQRQPPLLPRPRLRQDFLEEVRA